MEQTQIDLLKEKFSSRIIDFHKKSDKRYYILIDSNDLIETIWYIFHVIKARFLTVTGLDTREGIEIVYHFSLDQASVIINIRTIIPLEKPEIESIAGLIKGAAWIEREIQDILGVKFLNHPDPRRFMMADDWPHNVYPLRRNNGS